MFNNFRNKIDFVSEQVNEPCSRDKQLWSKGRRKRRKMFYMHACACGCVSGLLTNEVAVKVEEEEVKVERT